MEKSLLDFLTEEQGLVREIDRLEQLAERTSKQRIFLLMNSADLEVDKQYIKQLQNDIDELNNRKFDCKRKLEEVRRSIAGYIKYLNK